MTWPIYEPDEEQAPHERTDEQPPAPSAERTVVQPPRDASLAKGWAGIGLAILFGLAALSSITTDLTMASMCLGMALLVGYGGHRYAKEYREQKAAYDKAIRESPEPRYRPPNR